jgi:hypothetical protein
MSLYDDVEVNEDNNYEIITLNTFAFNDQDLERMINEANAFVDNFSCENVFVSTLLVSSLSREDQVSTETIIVFADFDIIFAESDIIFTDFDDIILADSKIVLEESDIVLAESNTVLAEKSFDQIFVLEDSDIILAESDIVLAEKSFDQIFEKILNEVVEDSSSFENFNAEISSIISFKKKFEIEILNNLALFTSTSFSTFTNTSVIRTARKTSVTSITKKNKKDFNKITKLLNSRKFKFQLKDKYINFVQYYNI